ncbi:pyruvate/2-oxoglutarate dehydrogenase complex dihydrolipoamide acyltransferase (E2) component [Kitasatospora sp. GAS204A]|uniref:2-oxo acid dehydrogenase subunit E2 n=1 Tax=unclassified Kitasatospora TaxID=2633591 RepID=UPI002472F922|nr:2-oxo acid dehydrogenase subunit E2 [Kitasatospora sp. GAS204B]MDH6118812.1 pyruvate/2-oxoglutarate dehydrogenase complex dihydrolipoamide acyltransferase (E2) component [Kitasatospora sp. GAS204B]
MTRIEPLPRQRRHTLRFLEYARDFAPVYLDTEVDLTAVRAHRAAAAEAGLHYSWVSYLLHTTGRVLAAHPDANAALRGRLRPRLARYDSVDAKLALDKTLDGRRVVLSALLPGVQAATLAQIQAQVDHYRDGDPQTMPEFAPTRALQRLPWPLGAAAFNAGIRPLGGRRRRMGTVAVSSLGHRAVDGFHSVGGTTVTLGVGRVVDRPVVRDGQLAIAPVLRLSLAFDHRVIDGAEAADVLTELRDGLQDFAQPQPQPQPQPQQPSAPPPATGRTVAAVAGGLAEEPSGRGGA